MRIPALAAIAIATLASASAAAAYDPIVLARGWARVAAFEQDGCAGEVGSNGRFYVLSVTGLAPGELASLTITNDDMIPIVRAVRADARGEWRDYYIPFRYNRGEGGAVSVTVAGAECVVPLAFDWTRAKGWQDPAPLEPG